MTHDRTQLDVRVASLRMLPLGNCQHCGNDLEGHCGHGDHLLSLVGEHDENCSLRIVIEAALENTESEGA